MKKKFCILEQGKTINDKITLEHKAQFQTKFSDFYRLNWDKDNDPNATFFKKNITWSEGRSLLYKKTPKNYEYYVFIDDDVKFVSQNTEKGVAELIYDFLEQYKPIIATLFSNNWHNSLVRKLHPIFKKDVFPYMGQDLEIQILKEDYAKIIFPVIYHGCFGSLWYANFFCYQLYPEKQLCFSKIKIENTNRHEGLKLNQNLSKSVISKKLNEHLLKSDFPFNKYMQRTKYKNLWLYLFGNISKQKINISLNDLSKIYDIYNSDFLNRKTLIKDGSEPKTN